MKIFASIKNKKINPIILDTYVGELTPPSKDTRPSKNIIREKASMGSSAYRNSSKKEAVKCK